MFTTVYQMNRLEPFLRQGIERLHVHPMALLHAASILFFSLMNFLFDDTLGRVLVLRPGTAKFLLPFIFNIFTETHVLSSLVNPVVSVFLVDELLSRLPVEQVALVGCCVGVTSNGIAWIILELISFVVPSFDFGVSGSLATLVSLAVLVIHVHVSRGMIPRLPVPYEVVAVVCAGVLTLLTSSTLCAVVGCGISVFLVRWHSQRFGIPVPDGPNDEPSIVESLGLAENPELSEADRNRRMRVLRAIEERLETFQSPQV